MTNPTISKRQPILSVVMPVHNALPYLDEAIESILNQTLPDFEFIIFDDASTDGSNERLREWAGRDARIHLIESSRNLGPAGSSNRVARAASAPVVARMDADDISYPKRLERQYELLSERPDVGLVACLYDVVDAHGTKLRNAEAWRISRSSPFVPFAHGTIMYRTNVFNEVGGYRAQCEYWEDQDLIARIAISSKVMVIPQTLYRVRQSPVSTRAASDQDKVERAVDLMYRSVQRLGQGRDYDDLLRTAESHAGKLDPRVFIAVGSVYLWSGGKPRLFRRLLDRGRLSFNRTTALAIAWTAWASLSPASLRAVLKALLAARNAIARKTVSPDLPIDWRPFVQNN